MKSTTIKDNSIMYTFLNLVGIFVLWTSIQFLSLRGPEQFGFLADFLFVTFLYGITGVFFPLIIGKKSRFKYVLYKSNVPKYILGFILCAGGILFGIVGSGAFLKVIQSDIPFSVYVKYLLLFFPFAVMLSHSFFFLIPNCSNRMTKNRHSQIFLSLLFTMLFSFLFFWGDNIFTNIEFPIVMSVLGLVFTGVFILTNSFELALGGYFLVMYFNTLEEAKYFGVFRECVGSHG